MVSFHKFTYKNKTSHELNKIHSEFDDLYICKFLESFFVKLQGFKLFSYIFGRTVGSDTVLIFLLIVLNVITSLPIDKMHAYDLHYIILLFMLGVSKFSTLWVQYLSRSTKMHSIPNQLGRLKRVHISHSHYYWIKLCFNKCLLKQYIACLSVRYASIWTSASCTAGGYWTIFGLWNAIIMFWIGLARLPLWLWHNVGDHSTMLFPEHGETFIRCSL